MPKRRPQPSQTQERLFATEQTAADLRRDVELIVEQFLTKPLALRLSELSSALKKRDPEMAARIRQLLAALVRWDGGTVEEQAGLGRTVRRADRYVQANLADALFELLHRLTLESLLGAADPDPDGGVRQLRRSAGLKSHSNAQTENFISAVHQRLWIARRRESAGLKPGRPREKGSLEYADKFRQGKEEFELAIAAAARELRTRGERVNKKSLAGAVWPEVRRRRGSSGRYDPRYQKLRRYVRLYEINLAQLLD